MKKWAIILLLICFAISSTMLLTSCSKGGDGGDTNSLGQDTLDYDNLNYDSNPEHFKFAFDGVDGYSLRAYTGESEFIEIPSTYNGSRGEYKVKSIGYQALFYAKDDTFEGYDPNKPKLRAVKIPNTIETIEEWAFGYNTELRRIEIPSSVKTIGKSAFNGCSSLEKMVLPFVGNEYLGDKNTHFGYIFAADTWTNNGRYIPETLREIVITGGTTIHEGDLAYVGTVEKLTLPDSLRRIKKHGLWYMESLKDLVIPDGVTEMGDSCLNGCSSLKNLTLPFLGETRQNTSGHIGYIFGANEGKKNAQYMPTSLETVTLTKQERLASMAFYGLKNLKKVVMPSSLEDIEDDAFQGCTSLEYTKKDGIYYLSANDNAYMFAMDADKDITTANIDSNCKAIMADAFSNCYKLQAVNIPDSVTKIGKNAFYRCVNLTSITIPDSVKKIGDSAFFGDTKLKSVTINKTSNITLIGSNAFTNCEALEKFDIPVNIRTIGKYAFYGCPSLKKVNIYSLDGYLRATLNNVYSTPFANAEELYIDGVKVDSITTPTTITTIKPYAFANLKAVKSITISKEVLSFSDWMFYGMTENQSIVLLNAKSANDFSVYIAWNYGTNAKITYAKE